MATETEKVNCSFCGKSQDEVGKIIAGPAVYICDECIDLCNGVIEEELLVPEDEDSPSPLSTTFTPFVHEVVTHFADSNVAADYTLAADGVDWMCEGCGWSLRLKPGAKPPSEHSEQVPLGLLGGPIRELPRLELAPRCPNPEWKRFP